METNQSTSDLSRSFYRKRVSYKKENRVDVNLMDVEEYLTVCVTRRAVKLLSSNVLHIKKGR